MAVTEMEAALPVQSIPVRVQVFADEGTTDEVKLSRAVTMMLTVLKSRRKWAQQAAQLEPIDGKPGDCLFMPPACLMDLDEMSRGIAKLWRLALGELTHPETGKTFLHCWLEFEDAAVSVSNLKNGYPLYAKARAEYYSDNGLVGKPMYVSSRSLRVAGRRLGVGSDLAKWLGGQWEKRQ